MPLVSYLITVCNKASYLPFTVEGLRQQEGPFDREFIFVDDGSTDDSPAIVKRLTSGWDNVTIVTQENSGPAHATNHAIAMAQGDYVKPVDADDVLTPWATQVLLDSVRETGCSVAYSFFGRALPYDQNGTLSPSDLLWSRQRRPGRLTTDPDGLFKSLDGPRMSPASWLARTDVVKATGGCDPNIFVQDYSIELRLALRTHFAEVHEPVFWVPTNLSGRVSENRAQLLHDEHMALAGLLRDEPELSVEIKQYALRRAVNRAWGWARRRSKAGLFSRDHRRFLAQKLGLAPATADAIFKTCEVFRETDRIRFPPKAAEQGPLPCTGTTP